MLDTGLDLDDLRLLQYLPVEQVCKPESWPDVKCAVFPSPVRYCACQLCNFHFLFHHDKRRTNQPLLSCTSIR